VLALAFAALVFPALTTRLAAQDVTVMPLALVDSPGISNRPDTPPALRKELKPDFPGELRAINEPAYVIFAQGLDEKGTQLLWSVRSSNAAYDEKGATRAFSSLRSAPAQKKGNPVASWSWLGVIFNPVSASEKNADATPRLLKVAPVFITWKQWLAFPKGPRVVRGSIEIDTAGSAKNLKIEKNAIYTRAVLPALERSLAQWQFAPARKDGRPVPASLSLGFVLQVNPNSEDGDKPPKATKQTAPVYPKIMKSRGMVGEVTLAFVVDADGNVTVPTVLRSNNPNFDQPAIDAVLQWKFKPATKNGAPAGIRMQIPIPFNLMDYDDAPHVHILGTTIWVPRWPFLNPGDNDPDYEGKTAYITSQPSKEQMAKMPEGLRYDVAPKVLGVVYPVYPYELFCDGKKGEATVAVLITSGSVVARMGVAKETAPELGYAALAACEYFEFAPALLDGKPTDAMFTIRQEFNNDSPFVTDADRAMLRLEKESPQEIVTAGKLDSVPKHIVFRQPPFPLAARQLRFTGGDAVVEFLIDTDGKVRLPRIVSSTHPLFGYQAVQTMANWRYEPPMSQGKPVVTRARIPFHFTSGDARAPGG
jgi:TonB family protein